MSRARTHARPQKAEARAVLRRNDAREREAERVAEQVLRGGSVSSWSFSAVSVSAADPVQRDEAAKPQSDEEKKKQEAEDKKTKDALKAAGEAALKTPQGQAVKEKVIADPLVKTVTDAIFSPAGKIATGAVLAGGVTALAVTGKELPIQPPEIPLEKLSSKLAGVSAKVQWEGPVARPTNVGLTIAIRGKGEEGKGKKTDPIAADIARLKAQQEMFKPVGERAAEKQAEDEAIAAWLAQQRGTAFTIPLPTQPAKKEEETPPAQPAPASPSAAPPAHANVDDALSAPGRPLDPATRHSMEARFGYDFSSVRIHDDARAATTAAGIDAAAFTVGEDIVFGTGRYAPNGEAGRRLLAHELAHVVQQGRAEPSCTVTLVLAGVGPTVSGGRVVQRRCACGGRAVDGGECDRCRRRRLAPEADPAKGAFAVTPADHRSESDAERAAETALRPDAQRPILRRAGSAPAPPFAPPIVHEVLRSGGRSLDGPTRALFEPRLGADFGAVRIHSDARAAASAEAVGATAYTVGRDIVFGGGRYALRSLEGVELLGHELAHVVQQRGAIADSGVPLRVGARSDPEEASARRFGETVPRDRSPAPVLRRATGDPLTWIAGFFSSIAHWFVDFSPETLQRYLDQLEKNRDIEGDPDSDDKARAIVSAWVADHRAFRLSPLLKQLLISELLDGPTTESDEDAIVDLLEGSDDPDIRAIFAARAVDPQQLLGDIDNDAPRRRLERFFTRRFVGGQAAVLAGKRELRPYLNLKALLPEQIDAFLVKHFPGPDRVLARKVVDDLRTVKEGEVDFASEDELRAEVFKRMRASQLMQQSQNSQMFDYPEALTEDCEGYDTAVPKNLTKHARVNKAASEHWTPPIPDPQGFYFFNLSPLGRERPFEAVTLLFTPQASVCDRTLIHCDYLTSVIQLRAFAESIGPTVFDERVRKGAIVFALTYYGAEYITSADWAAGRSRFPVSRESVSLQIVRPSSEADLVIGDHVIFWNHLAYDALSVKRPGPWRLENAVLIDKDDRNRDLYEGHGAPAVGQRIVPGPKEDILGELLTQYNRYAEDALDVTRQVEAGQLGARERLRDQFPQVESGPSGWAVRELPRNFPFRRERFYVLRQLTSIDDPELIGLRDQLDHSKIGPVERPVESREKPL